MKKLDEIKKSFNRIEEEILDLECDYTLELDEEDPEWIRLELIAWEEAMDYLHDVAYASNLFQKIGNILGNKFMKQGQKIYNDYRMNVFLLDYSDSLISSRLCSPFSKDFNALARAGFTSDGSTTVLPYPP